MRWSEVIRDELKRTEATRHPVYRTVFPFRSWCVGSDAQRLRAVMQPGGEADVRTLTMTRVPENPDVLEGTPGLRPAARRQTYQTQRLAWTWFCRGEAWLRRWVVLRSHVREDLWTEIETPLIFMQFSGNPPVEVLEVKSHLCRSVTCFDVTWWTRRLTKTLM